MSVTLRDIEAARERIAGGVLATPCVESRALSELTGARIFCKLENQQRTGSFKERGARNALLLLGPEEKRRGVIAASAGNHASALAYHGHLLGVPVTVAMPEGAPLIKVGTCERLGARVLQRGSGFAEARAFADELSASEGLTYINGFDDAAVIAGQGTIGLELLEQVPDAEAVVVPVGGGGLIAGIATALRTRRSRMKVFGVESRRTASFTAALKAGRPVRVPMRATLADGLAIPEVGARAFELARRGVANVVRVPEDLIALAILRTIELEKGVVEGAAAAALAALLPHGSRRPALSLRGKTVILVFAGGNIDPLILSRVIEKGLVADGRRFRFTAVISDRPGGLARLSELIAEAGASITDIAHERAFSGSDVSTVHAVCTVETHDRAHARALLRALRAADIQISARSLVR